MPKSVSLFMYTSGADTTTFHVYEDSPDWKACGSLGSIATAELPRFLEMIGIARDRGIAMRQLMEHGPVRENVTLSDDQVTALRKCVQGDF